MDNEFSWTLFFKMTEFKWTFSEGEFSWTLLVNSHGHFCPREFGFLGDSGDHKWCLHCWSSNAVWVRFVLG